MNTFEKVFLITRMVPWGVSFVLLYMSLYIKNNWIDTSHQSFFSLVYMGTHSPYPLGTNQKLINKILLKVNHILRNVDKNWNCFFKRIGVYSF